MSSRFKELRFSELATLRHLVDETPLSEIEARAAILNLIDRVEQLECSHESDKRIKFAKPPATPRFSARLVLFLVLVIALIVGARVATLYFGD